jgi:hypothetical protein
MSLTDREQEQLKAMIDAGEPLPQKYRAVLFADPHEAELIWPGKTSDVTSVVLPFQSIEQIDERREEMNAQGGGRHGQVQFVGHHFRRGASELFERERAF